MLDKVRRSACKPAPLVGSVAAKVRTTGGVWRIYGSKVQKSGGVQLGDDSMHDRFSLILAENWQVTPGTSNNFDVMPEVALKCGHVASSVPGSIACFPVRLWPAGGCRACHFAPER